MNGKAMLSVERELLAKLIEEGRISEISDAEWKELRALLVKPEDMPDRYADRDYCVALEQERDYLREQLNKPATHHQGGVTLEQVLNAYDYANSHPHKYLRGTTNWCAAVAHALNVQHPAPVADHTQCEECKGWGYHENHHEGGGTECGECSGSGKAQVEQFSGDTVVCRRYQLEQHPGQNFYHYDLEPVYGSVPVTVSELITMVESAPVAVVLPDRLKTEPFTTIDRGSKNYKAGHNAAIAKAAKLNGLKP